MCVPVKASGFLAISTQDFINTFLHLVDASGNRVLDTADLFLDTFGETYNHALDVFGFVDRGDKLPRWNSDTNEFEFPLNDDGSFTVTNDFINVVNKAVSDSVTKLDGYYLIEPDYPLTANNFTSLFYGSGSNLILNALGNSVVNSINDGAYNTLIMRRNTSSVFAYAYCSSVDFSDSNCIYYVGNSNYVNFIDLNDDLKSKSRSFSGYTVYGSTNTSSPLVSFNQFTNKDTYVFLGNKPFKLFYSYQDAMIYYNNNFRKSNFAPFIPSGLVGVNLTDDTLKKIGDLINDALSDLDFPEGSSDEDIQVFIDNRVQEFIDNYFNQYEPSPTPPPATPTPSPGTGGGTGGGDSLSSSWLEKIYNWLVDFGKTNDTFTKKLITLIESSDGKLDQIVTALDKILQNEPVGDDAGCKYDYTELSDFLTDLWNESDQKFDRMIALLEENNDYQDQILNTLEDIRTILFVDSIFDTFKDRSQETAEKARERFPTSIPWDISLVVNAMCAEPQIPVLRCPIDIQSLNIHEEIVIDLSGDSWSKLAKTCRSMLSLLFVLYLIHLTRMMFFNGGDKD